MFKKTMVKRDVNRWLFKKQVKTNVSCKKVLETLGQRKQNRFLY